MGTPGFLSGLAAAIALAFGLDVIIPLGTKVCSFFDLIAVASGVAFIGLIEGA